MEDEENNKIIIKPRQNNTVTTVINYIDTHKINSLHKSRTTKDIQSDINQNYSVKNNEICMKKNKTKYVELFKIPKIPKTYKQSPKNKKNINNTQH